MSDAKAREIDKIINKLGMETRNSRDHHAWLVHDGVVVVRTRRSHGKGKFVPADKIRCQLKVNEQQFAGLISCHVTKEQYIDILVQKKLIAPKPEPPAVAQKKNPST
jgi:hypothetical protein